MLELLTVALASLLAGFIDAVAGGGGLVLVPALFFWEVANALLMAVRRQRLSQAERVEALQLLEAQGFDVDPASPAVIWHDVIHLAEQCQLTAYDAAYLELAMRRGLPLATHDRALRAAARSLGVELLLG